MYDERDVQLLDSREEIAKVDPSGMTRLVEGLPEQWLEAEAIARKAELGKLATPERVVVLGMGGSAIGGDFLRSLLETKVKVPIFVNRSYALPAFVDERTLVVASSYSGNTEETLIACEAAKARGAAIAAITTGGELARRAQAEGWPLIRLPGGLPPRAAIGYSFVPLLVLMERVGVCPPVAADLAEAHRVLVSLRERYNPDVPTEKNKAKQIALAFKGKLPLIYGSEGWKGAAAYRWKTQINENSKAPAVWNAFPELNHNETVGWETPPEVTRSFEVVVLRDKRDLDRIQTRIEVTTREIMEGAVSGITELWAEGESEVARLFSLVYPGDWVSLYLALAYRIDPTPVKMIDLLKNRLASA